MLLEILTPDKTLFSGEVTGVKVPGSSGSFEMLDKHAAIVSRLEKGTVTVRTAGGDQDFEIQGGVVEMLDNKIIILA